MTETYLWNLYDIIKYYTDSEDVIFSTVDPWTYYYSLDAVPVDEYPGALFIGPAAYIGAHHGAPVIIVDNHPEQITVSIGIAIWPLHGNDYAAILSAANSAEHYAKQRGRNQVCIANQV